MSRDQSSIQQTLQLITNHEPTISIKRAPISELDFNTIDSDYYELISLNSTPFFYKNLTPQFKLIFDSRHIESNAFKMNEYFHSGNPEFIPITNQSLLNIKYNPDQASLAFSFSLNDSDNAPSQALSGLYKVTKFSERYARYSGLNTPRLPRFNAGLKKVRYFSTFRDGEAFKVPFDFADSNVKSKFFRCSPKIFLAIDATAMLTDSIAPTLIENNNRLIEKHESFLMQVFSNLSEVDQLCLQSDSLANDMRFANNQLQAVYAATNGWVRTSRYLYEACIPKSLRQATRNFRQSISDTSQLILTNHIQHQNNISADFEPDFDTECLFTFRDVSNFLSVMQAPVNNRGQVSDPPGVIDEDLSTIDELSKTDITTDPEMLDSEPQSADMPSLSADTVVLTGQNHFNDTATNNNLGEFNYVIDRVDGAVFVGAGWTPQYSDMQYNLGIQFDDQSINIFVNKLLERIFARNSEYKQLAFCGHEYGYKVKENNASATITIYPLAKSVANDRGKKEIVVPLHFWSGLWKDAFKNGFSSGEHRANAIGKALIDELAPYVNKNFINDVSLLSEEVAKKLDSGFFVEAKQLLQDFYNNYKDHPSAKSAYDSVMVSYDFNILISQVNALFNQENSAEEIQRLIQLFEQQYQGNDLFIENVTLLKQQVNDALLQQEALLGGTKINKKLDSLSESITSNEVEDKLYYTYQPAAKKRRGDRHHFWQLAVNPMFFYSSLSFAVSAGMHYVDSRKNKLSALQFASAKCFIYGVGVFNTIQLNRLQGKILTNFEIFQLSLGVYSVARQALFPMLPLSCKSHVSKLNEISGYADLAATGMVIGRKAIQYGDKFAAAYRMKDALLFQDTAQAFTFDVGITALAYAINKSASHYGQLRINGAAREDWQAIIDRAVSNPAVSVAAHPLVLPWVVPAIGYCLSLSPEPVTWLVGAGIAAYAAYDLSNAQNKNILTNAEHRVITALCNPHLFSDTKNKLANINSQTKINLSNGDHAPIANALLDEFVKDNVLAEKLYAQYKSQHDDLLKDSDNPAFQKAASRITNRQIVNHAKRVALLQKVKKIQLEILDEFKSMLSQDSMKMHGKYVETVNGAYAKVVDAYQLKLSYMELAYLTRRQKAEFKAIDSRAKHDPMTLHMIAAHLNERIDALKADAVSEAHKRLLVSYEEKASEIRGLYINTTTVNACSRSIVTGMHLFFQSVSNNFSSKTLPRWQFDPITPGDYAGIKSMLTQ